MKIAEVKITEWEDFYFLKSDQDELCKGDKIVVNTSHGEEIGTIVKFIESENDQPSFPLQEDFFLRKADENDLKQLAVYEQGKEEVLNYCKENITKLGLMMKLVSVSFSFDGKKITFVFTAEGRVDFRELVKILSRRFQKSIRMHQIGIRDEAKISGEMGMCGRELCCKRFLKELVSIGSELADIQQVAHRGVDRISGICGRLMCCLNYEREGYQELSKRLPIVGSFVKFEDKEYKVLGWHILKQTVDLQIDDDTTLEVEVEKLGLDK